MYITHKIKAAKSEDIAAFLVGQAYTTAWG